MCSVELLEIQVPLPARKRDAPCMGVTAAARIVRRDKIALAEAGAHFFVDGGVFLHLFRGDLGENEPAVRRKEIDADVVAVGNGKEPPRKIGIGIEEAGIESAEIDSVAHDLIARVAQRPLRLVAVLILDLHVLHDGEEGDDDDGEHGKTHPEDEVEVEAPGLEFFMRLSRCLRRKSGHGYASNLYPKPRRVTMNLRYSLRLPRSILTWVSTVRSSP